jgi:hypothetical protein
MRKKSQLMSYNMMIGYDIYDCLQWSIFDCAKERPWQPKFIARDCTLITKLNYIIRGIKWSALLVFLVVYKINVTKKSYLNVNNVQVCNLAFATDREMIEGVKINNN